MAKVRFLWDQRIVKGARRLPGTLNPVDFDTPEEFAATFADQLRNAARWFTKQSTEGFHELRMAGYIMDLAIDIWARVGQEPIQLDLPPEFLFECGRLGLKVALTTNNIGLD